MLCFNGRVKLTSVKNFQIAENGKIMICVYCLGHAAPAWDPVDYVELTGHHVLNNKHVDKLNVRWSSIIVYT